MNKKVLLLICLFTGMFGGHYFATKRYGKGFLYFFTCGLFLVGWFIDLIKIATSDDFIAIEEAKRQKAIEKKIEKRKEAKAVLDEAFKERSEQKSAEQEKVERLQAEGIPYCPKCKSTSLTANKKGFGLAKGAAGVILAGPIGATAAGIGKNKVIITCLNCGYQFKPGKK